MTEIDTDIHSRVTGIVKKSINRIFYHKELQWLLLDSKLDMVFNNAPVESVISDPDFFYAQTEAIAALKRPKIIVTATKRLLVVPAMIKGKPEYFVILSKMEAHTDDLLKFDKSNTEFIKMAGQLFYFLCLTLQNQVSTGHNRAYLEHLSRIIEFDDIPNDREMLEKKIQKILASLISITDSCFAGFHLFDKKKNVLMPVKYTGSIKPEVINEDFSRMKDHITNVLWKSKDIIRTSKDKDSQKLFRMFDNYINGDIYAYLGVPVKANDEYIGIIELFNTKINRIYNEEDEYLIRSMANYMTFIYKNYEYLLQEKQSREQLLQANNELKKAQSDLNAFLLRISALYKINKVIRSVIDLDDMIKKLIDVIGKATESDEVFIFLKDEQKYELILYGCPKEYISSVGFVRIPFGKGIEGIVAQTRMPIAVTENVINDSRYESILDLEMKFFNSLLVAPIIIKDNVIGVLELRNSSKRTYSPSEKKLINTITDQLGIAIENALLHKKTELLSLTDDMTGLFNFRYFQQKIRDEIIRSKRYQRDLSLLILDIDHFKKVNDTFGHTKGDYILKIVSNIISRTVRDVDISCRYGGEEFVVILPETEQKDTLPIAERIRLRVEDADFAELKELEDLKITISIGVASFPENATNEKGLIEAADKALYYAKNTGRNKVVGYSAI